MKKQSILSLLSAAVLAAGLLAPSVAMAGEGNACRHWDKIIFELKNVQIVRDIQNANNGLTLPKGSPLDIVQTQDNQNLRNANGDLEQLITDATLVVLNRFNLGDTPARRAAIRIIDVDYAIECPENSNFSNFD